MRDGSTNFERLEGVLSEDPELVRARSTREHRSTLLYYSSNGVGDVRQNSEEHCRDHKAAAEGRSGSRPAAQNPNVSRIIKSEESSHGQ